MEHFSLKYFLDFDLIIEILNYKKEQKLILDKLFYKNSKMN